MLKILEDFDFVNHLPKCDIPRDKKGLRVGEYEYYTHHSIIYYYYYFK